MVKQLSQEEKAARAAEELRALIREGHEVAKALTEAIRAGRRQVDEYMENSLVQQFRDYRAATQVIIDKNIANIEATAQAMLDGLQRQLQSVANNHVEVYYGLAENLALGIDPPGPGGKEERRQAIIEAGDRIVETYRRAGLEIAGEDTHPELTRALRHKRLTGEIEDPRDGLIA